MDSMTEPGMALLPLWPCHMQARTHSDNGHHPSLLKGMLLRHEAFDCHPINSMHVHYAGGILHEHYATAST